MRKIFMLGACAAALALVDPPGGQALRAGTLDAALGTAAGLAAWLICCYLALCSALSVMSRVPGALGRTARRAGAAITPAALRGVLGLTCSVGIAIASPARAAQCPTICPIVSVDRPAADAPPNPAPPTPAASRHRTQPTVRSIAVVVVRRGDSLWSIAGRRLGARATSAAIATSWPRWYATNRAVIGPNPNLLFAGERLTPPNS